MKNNRSDSNDDLEYKQEMEAIKERFRKAKAQQQQRKDLLSDASKAVTAEDIDPQETSSPEELARRALSVADESKAALKKSRALAERSQQVAAGTLTSLQEQTEQISRVNGQLSEIGHNVSTSEKILKSMESVFVGLFGKSPPVPKSLSANTHGKKSPSSNRAKILTEAETKELKAEQKQNAKLSAAGHKATARGSGEVKQSADGSSARAANNPNLNLDPEEARKALFDRAAGRGAKASRRNGAGTSVEEETVDGYLMKVEKAKQEQDQDLDAIGQLVGNLKRMGEEMNNELKIQSKQMDDVTASAQKTGFRVKTANKRVVKLGE